jgi:hypothetical protein
MAITVKHLKVSTIPDAGDDSLIEPSDWNNDHVLTGTVPVANGGTGAATLTGYVKGTGTTAMTASATIPNTDITGLGTASTKDAGSANGVATLDAGGKVPVSELPAAVLGALSYQGTWNASTNSPTLTSSVGTKGYYYVVSVAGNTNLNGITDWLVGDWAVFNGSIWQKVDNTETVTSVNGQTGAVVLTTTNVAEGTNLYFTNARARTSISAGTGISYDNSTGVVTNSAPDQTVAIAGGTGISTSGTYPSFTVTNTAPDQTVVLNAGTGISTSGTYPNFTITNTSPSLGGDVVGPASATDNAVARFDSTTGKLLQNSVVTVGDTGAVSGVTTLSASTSVTSPILKAANSAGGALQNASGTSQIQWGGGGGNNVTIDVSANLNGANAQIDISPTGTGHVHINPTGTGSIEMNPTSAGTIDNMTLGATTPKNASVVDLSVTGTLSFDAAQGTAGQVLTSAGTGATPTWTTPTTGTVTSVTGTAPVVSSGGNTPAISMAAATGSVNGYLTSTDWTTFNGKAPAVTYTTNYVPFGQGTTTPNLSSSFTYVTGTGTLTAPAVSASNGLVINNNTVSASYSIPSGSSASSVGPMTVASGQTVTVPSGSRWVVL